MLLSVHLALAHVPHDLVAAVAIPADGDPTKPWFTLMNPQGAWLWARSDDAGRRWALEGGEPMGDEPSGAARLGDTLLVLGSRGLWWSDNEGASWTLEALPGEVSLVGGGVLAGQGGLWAGSPVDGWTQQTDTPIALLGPASAVDTGGQIWVHRDGWEAVGTPDADSSAVAWDGSTLWRGSRDGFVSRWDGATWQPCGALPTSDHEYNDVVRLAAMGSLLVATTSDGGPFASADACTSWSVLGVDQNIDHGAGGPDTEATSQTVLGAYGATWIFGGWAGLYLSSDGGESWTSPPLVPADYTRGVAFSPDWPEDPALYVAAYAAGPQRTDDGGRSWSSPAHGLSEANAQTVRVSPFDASTVYALLNHVGYKSHDGGERWDLLDPDAPPADRILPLPTRGRLWELTATLRESLDDGATWTDRDDLTEAFGAAKVAGYIGLEDRECVTLANPSGLACSFDAQETWSVWSDGATADVTSPRAWPFGAPSHLIWGDNSGLHRQSLVDDARQDVESEPILDLVVTADSSVFAVTRSSQLLRSDDGGETWTAIGPRLSATVMTLEARPDWLDQPQLLVGSHDGLFVVDPEGHAERIEYERIDDASSYLQCSGCPPAVAAGEAAFDTRQPIGSGTLLVPFRGTRVRVTGFARPGDGVEAFLDGVDLGGHARDAIDGTLLELDGLPAGWHELELVGLPETDVSVDFVEAWGEGAILPLPPRAPPVPEDCGGCGDGSAAGLLFLVGGMRSRTRRGTP